MPPIFSKGHSMAISGSLYTISISLAIKHFSTPVVADYRVLKYKVAMTEELRNVESSDSRR